jgi:hypothetical protein
MSADPKYLDGEIKSTGKLLSVESIPLLKLHTYGLIILVVMCQPHVPASICD